MSKRRISHQQSARIAKKQQSYRQRDAVVDQSSFEDGLVIKRFSRHALIESTQGSIVHCSIRPLIDTLVAGDKVVWQAEGEHNKGVVISRYPRQSMLGRPDHRGQLKPVAANISQVMIVIAPKPEISWSLLDSYLVMVEYLGLQACIVLNKIDLPCKALQQQLVEQYEPLGYTLLFTGPQAKAHDKNLKYQLDNQTSVFVGQSGVGKSSLISRILPLESAISIGAISMSTELGKHTTSSSCFYHIPTGGALIDSPGVREFGLWHMPATEIAKGYREFLPYLSNCKFRNCNHINSPDCALLLAVSEKLISRQRYENYVKLSSNIK